MKTIKNYEGARVIKATGDVFIIPNNTLKISTSMYKEKTINYAKLMYPLNNLSTDGIDENAEFVQTWIVSEEDLDTDNLGSHSASIMIDGVMYNLVFESSLMREYIPIDLFVGKKEGDVVTVRFGVNIVNTDEVRAVKKKSAKEETFEKPEGETVILELSLRLAQLEYRYRRFGTFEETLDALHPGIHNKFVKWADESNDSNSNNDDKFSRLECNIEMAVKISEIQMDILEYKMAIQRVSNHSSLIMGLSFDCDIDERIQMLDTWLAAMKETHDIGDIILSKTEAALEFCDKEHDSGSYARLSSIKERTTKMVTDDKQMFEMMSDLINSLKEAAKNCN